MNAIKHQLTDVAITASFILLGFALGYLYGQMGTIERAQEVIERNGGKADAQDLSYIAIGETSKSK